MTTELDNNTLEWAAQWLEGSLNGEPNERVREFGKNMAMTLRAAKLTDSRASVAAPPPDNGIPWTALLAVLERLRSKNRNPEQDWYNGWNAAIQCLINDINARSASPVAATDAETVAEIPYAMEMAVGKDWLKYKSAAERVVARIADNDCLTCKHWGSDAVYAIAVELATAAPSSPQPREAAMGAAEAIINYGESVRWGQGELPMFALEIAQIILLICFPAEVRDGQ